MKKVTILAALLILLSAPSVFSQNTVQLPATGQTKCYAENGGAVTCAGTGQDGEYRMGLAWPNPRFEVNGDCVTDNLTGLIWAKNANIPAAKKSWNDAIDFAKDRTLCGRSDWRLPNVNELDSLLNAGAEEPAAWLKSQGFANVQPTYYWSSTTYNNQIDQAWAVCMCSGASITGPKDNSTQVYVWPVAGETTEPALLWKTGQTASYRAYDDGELQKGTAWPDPRFTDHGDGTVTDGLTGLMWLKNANCIGTRYPSFDTDGAVQWQQALDFVAGTNDGTYPDCAAGHQDWRLPNKKEMFSLFDKGAWHPPLPADHPFTSIQDGGYWTSTSEAKSASTNRACIFSSWTGGDSYNTKTIGGGNYVWPVRGGSSSAPATATLTVSLTGNGKGSVTGKNVKCSTGTCTYTYESPDEVALTAKALSGSVFTGWSGCEVSSGTACSVTMSSDVTVTANFINPPRVALSPASLNFGTVRKDVAYSKTISVTNKSVTDLVVGLDITPKSTTEFEATGCDNPVANGMTCTITVSLTAVSMGTKAAQLAISTNDPKKPSIAVKLSGSAKPPKISASPASLNFGTILQGVVSGPKYVTVKNTGISDLSISAVSASTNPSFTVDGTACTASLITQGGKCTIAVTFQPSSAGAVTGQFEISSNAGPTPVRVKLSGKGKAGPL